MTAWQGVLKGTQRWSLDCADALQWLAQLPPDSVDLVFGSPPYEQARLYLEDGRDMGIARDTEEWVAWMVDIYRACLRVCRGLVAFVVEGQTRKYRYSCGPALLMADLHRAGICLRKPPAYHRVGIPGSGGPDWFRNDWEWVICATKGGKLPWSDNVACGHAPTWKPGGEISHRGFDGERVNEKRKEKTTSRGHQPDGNLIQGQYTPPKLANPGNVVRCVVGGGLLGHELAHENEAPYPLALAEFFVRSCCPPDGIVADVFSGSGTTLHAAIAHGRRFVGCDLRQSQVDLGTRRANSVTPPMFTEARS